MIVNDTYVIHAVSPATKERAPVYCATIAYLLQCVIEDGGVEFMLLCQSFLMLFTCI